MLLLYALNHALNHYQMWNPETNGVHMTLNIISFKKVLYQRLLLGIYLVVEPLKIENEVSGTRDNKSSRSKNPEGEKSNNREERYGLIGIE